MANRLETHFWYDGERWVIYTERAADIARFTGWFGKPDRLGRAGACAHWDAVPRDLLRVRRRRKANPASAALSSHRVAVLAKAREARRATGALATSGAEKTQGGES